MKKILKYIETRKEKYIEWAIFLLFGILSILINDAYYFNPFILAIIFFAYQRGINTYLISISGMLLTSFFIDINYGIEISIVQIIFFLSSIICCFIKNNFIKKYGSLIISQTFLVVLFLIKYLSIDNVLNMLVMSVAVVLIVYAYEQLIKCVYEKDHEFTSFGKVVVLSTISFWFFGFKFLYIFLIRLFHLINNRISPIVESLLAIIINCFIIYYFQDSSTTLIVLIIVPAIISAIINRYYSHFAYIITFIFLSIYTLDDFYLNKYFYQGISAFVIYIMIPSKWKNYLEQLFNRDDNKKVIEMNEQLKDTASSVNDIISYLDIVLTSSVEEKPSLEEKIYKIIFAKVCKECSKKERCMLSPLVKASLERDLTKEERAELFNKCLFPYKILRNVRLKKTTLDNERHFIEEIQNRNNLYKQEIATIYDPLRTIFSQSSLIKDRKMRLEEELSQMNYRIKDVSIYEKYIKFHIVLDKKEDINNVVELVSKILNKTYYVEDIFYILCLNEYEVTLSSKASFYVEQAIISNGADGMINGDSFLSFDEDEHHYLLFSDGIGHNKQSSNISLFLIQAINAFRKLENKILKQIETANVLLKSKINEEGYATLDYVDIDLVTGKMEIFKCGSFYSYLFREDKLSKFKSNTPPLGILYDIKTSSLFKELKHDDILIFMSDGYMDDPDYFIEDVLKRNFHKDVNEIATTLHNYLISKEYVNDDKTLIILKLMNVKNGL